MIGVSRTTTPPPVRNRGTLSLGCARMGIPVPWVDLALWANRGEYVDDIGNSGAGEWRTYNTFGYGHQAHFWAGVSAAGRGYRSRDPSYDFLQYLAHTNDGSLDPGDLSFSVRVVVVVEAAPYSSGAGGLFCAGRGTASTHEGWGVAMSAGSGLSFAACSDDGNADERGFPRDTSKLFEFGEVLDIVCTVDRSTDLCSMYLNGRLIDSDTPPSGFSSITTTPATISRYNVGYAERPGWSTSQLFANAIFNACTFWKGYAMPAGVVANLHADTWALHKPRRRTYAFLSGGAGPSSSPFFFNRFVAGRR